MATRMATGLGSLAPQYTQVASSGNWNRYLRNYNMGTTRLYCEKEHNGPGEQAVDERFLQDHPEGYRLVGLL